MAILLSLVGKRTKGLLLLRRKKYCTFNTIHCVIRHTINKTTVKVYKFAQSLVLMKDSFKSCRAENDFVISQFLIRRYLFHTIDRQYFTKTIAFQLLHDILDAIFSHQIHKILCFYFRLCHWNVSRYLKFASILNFFVIYKKGKALKREGVDRT